MEDIDERFRRGIEAAARERNENEKDPAESNDSAGPVGDDVE
jgi:hypothetical protein